MVACRLAVFLHAGAEIAHIGAIEPTHQTHAQTLKINVVTLVAIAYGEVIPFALPSIAHVLATFVTTGLDGGQVLQIEWTGCDVGMLFVPSTCPAVFAQFGMA